jgi:uroporphyrinogen-III synthase
VNALPLAGRRVLVTRAAHQAGKLSDSLRQAGGTPVQVPVLEICPPESFEAMDVALRGLGDYDWLILTSSNTVRALAQRARKLGVSLASTGNLQVAAVGQGTAAAARDAGLQITYVPETYVAESLVKGLAGNMAEKRVLLAQAAVARDVIPEAFRAAGAQVDVVAAYRNQMPASAPERLRAALAEGIDAATFTSSSSVTYLADAARAGGLAWPFAGVAAVSIGPITSATLRATGWEPAIEAGQSDIPGLVGALIQLFSRP